MDREIPRTLTTLSPDNQRGIEPDDYEVLVVDNGSPRPIAASTISRAGPSARLVRIDDASPSPAIAANVGLAEATGDLIGLIVDGARMASPGLLVHALLARRLAEHPVIATLGWHLGRGRHMDASARGYDQGAEDELLASVGWEADGYQLFTISTLAGSSGRGWFGPLGESSALFLRRATWDELGGLDEQFRLPGGGLVNHDLYHRACSLPGTQLVTLLGEGTFHQIHGGAATSRRLTWDEMNADHEAIRGRPYRPPRTPSLYLGNVPAASLPHLAESVALAVKRASKGA
jgi:hypothetical protein